MPIHEHEQCEHGEVTEAEDHHQTRHLIGILDHGDDCSVWQPHFTLMPGEHADKKSEFELQRIDVEQHHEQ